MAGHQAYNSFRPKPRDHKYFNIPSSQYVQKETSLPLQIDLNSSGQVSKCDNPENDHPHPQLPPWSVWPYGLIDSQPQPAATSTKPVPANAAPDDLELSLAPRPRNRNKSSPASHLIGPISVV